MLGCVARILIVMVSITVLLVLAAGIAFEFQLLSTAAMPPESPPLQTPLQQLRDGVLPTEVLCADNMVLMQRDARPACVSTGTADKLEGRGWEMVVHTDLTRQHSPIRTDPGAVYEHRSDAGVKHELVVYGEPSVPLVADTTLTISNIPRIDETAVLTMTTTLPTYFYTLDDNGGHVKKHVPDNHTGPETTVGFELSSHLDVLDLDPRLAEFNVINEGPDYGYRTHLKSMTQLTVTPGQTYSFNITIQPVQEGQIGISAYGFAGDRIPLALAVGGDTAMLSRDYYENNETFLERLDEGAAGPSEDQYVMVPIDIHADEYVPPPPLSDDALEGIYLHVFTPGQNADEEIVYTVQEMVDEMLNHGQWDKDRIQRFLRDVMKVTDEEIAGVTFDRLEK